MQDLTPAQLRLIRWLVDDCKREESVVRQRWSKGGEQVKRVAIARDALVLCRNWTEDHILTADGDVFILDTDDEPGTTRPTSGSERAFGLFQGLRRYPELASLLPSRPLNAEVCPGCGGAGIILDFLDNPDLRDAVTCQCGGSGWVAE